MCVSMCVCVRRDYLLLAAFFFEPQQALAFSFTQQVLVQSDPHFLTSLVAQHSFVQSSPHFLALAALAATQGEQVAQASASNTGAATPITARIAAQVSNFFTSSPKLSVLSFQALFLSSTSAYRALTVPSCGFVSESVEYPSKTPVSVL